jgi:hypothetical protein
VPEPEEGHGALKTLGWALSTARALAEKAEAFGVLDDALLLLRGKVATRVPAWLLRVVWPVIEHLAYRRERQ